MIACQGEDPDVSVILQDSNDSGRIGLIPGPIPAGALTSRPPDAAHSVKSNITPESLPEASVAGIPDARTSAHGLKNVGPYLYPRFVTSPTP